MKKIISFLVVAVLLGHAADAQIRRTSAVKSKKDSAAVTGAESQTGNQPRRKMLKDLQLDNAQKEKLKGMKADAKAQKEAIENDTQLSAAEKEAKLRALRHQQAEKLNGVLTDEQKEKLRKMRRNKRKDAAAEPAAQQ